MRTNHITAGACAAAVISFAMANPALAQEAPAGSAAPAVTDEEVVVLSPFVVSATESNSGYAVQDTLAGTRVRTSMKDVASALSVVSKQFMQDVGATDSTSLLQYTANTEVGGTRGNFLGTNYATGSGNYGQGGQTPSNNTLLRPSSNTRVRGLSAADNTRDYFLTNIPWDSFNVDRVDIQRGPNSILFGVGSPAGIINTSVNTASFKTGGKLETQFDKWGTIRNSLDYNQALIPQTLAVRVSLLDDREKFEQKPAFDTDRRAYAAVRYDPKLVENGSTTIRANFERGKVAANRPRSLTPEDFVTRWFDTSVDANGVAGMNKLHFNRATDSVDLNANANNPQLNGTSMGRMYWPGVVGYHGAADGTAAPFYETPMISFQNGLGSNGAIDNNVGDILSSRRPFAVGSYKQYAINANLPGSAFFVPKSLTDSSIFDFYTNLLDGDNKREWQEWTAGNISIAQTFLNNRVGFEVVYDNQKYNDGQESMLGNAGAYGIGIDINDHGLRGESNPNYGKLYVSSDTYQGGVDSRVDREGIRATTFAELRFEDFMKKSWLTGVLGRHVFTGLYSKDTVDQRDRAYSLGEVDPAYPRSQGDEVTVDGHHRHYNWVAYLSDSLANLPSASGANASRIRMKIDVPSVAPVTYWDNAWNSTVSPGDQYSYVDREGVALPNSTQSENSANYVGWVTRDMAFQSVAAGDKESLITSDNESRTTVTSKALTWQGYLFDGSFVPVFGLREDTVKLRAGADAQDAYGVVDGSYDYDPTQASKSTGRSKSWGGVLHTPASIAAKMPWRTSLSLFYNRSSNFSASAPRLDVLGNVLGNPQANTKEYGFAISTLADRLTLRVNWYETKMQNASIDTTNGGFSYQQWALPAWLIAQGSRYAAVRDGRIGDTNWDGLSTSATYNGVTPDQIAAALVALRDFPGEQLFFDSRGAALATINLAALRSGDIYTAYPLWSVGKNDPQQLPSSTVRASVGSTTSKGIEFDLTAQPTKNWNVTLNVTKVEATVDSVIPTLVEYMNDMNALFAGPAGELRMWGETGSTFRSNWEGNVRGSFDLLMAKLGKTVDDLAPWRANLVTTYTFDDGFAKGFFVGGGYRWEDKRVLGYAIAHNTSDPTRPEWVSDLDRPRYSETSDHYDLWFGYSRKLSSKIDWRIQLNLRNVGESHHLVPVSVQPDGSWGLVRIEDGMSWRITNTFSF